MGNRALTRIAPGFASLALAVLAAGCGGGSSSGSASPVGATTGTTTNAPGGGANAAAFQAYQACLKAQGVTLSFRRGARPPGAQGGTPPTATGPTSTTPTSTTAAPPAGTTPRGGLGQLTAKQRKAMAACQSKLPANARGFGGATGGGNSDDNSPANAALKKYTACLKSHGVTFGSSSTSSKAFAKATAACKSLLPTSAGGSVNGGATTP